MVSADCKPGFYQSEFSREHTFTAHTNLVNCRHLTGRLRAPAQTVEVPDCLEMSSTIHGAELQGVRS